MNWKTHQIDHIHAIRANVTGPISEEEFNLLGIEVCFAVQQNEYGHILLDLSGATPAFPRAQLANLIELYVEYQLPKSIRSAIVLSTKDWPEDYSKLIVAAADQGYSMKLLVAESEVKAWLADAT